MNWQNGVTVNKKYIISIDGGGTKTEFCVLEIHKNEKKSFTFGSSNYKSVGLQTAKQNITQSYWQICTEMEIQNEQIEGIVIGISGCDTRHDYKVYRDIIKDMNLSEAKVYLCNDSELLFLSIAQAPGIGVVAGTGTIAIGFDNEQNKARCGGWGSPLSDLGSGYWIGEKVIREWIRCYDKQVPEQPVFHELEVFYGLQDEECIPHRLTELNITEIASCAKVVAQEAERKSMFCAQIIEEAAGHTAELAHGVYQQLALYKNQTIDMLVSGSIFKSNYFYKLFKEKAEILMKDTTIHFITVDESPANSGLKLAKNKFCNSNKEQALSHNNHA